MGDVVSLSSRREAYLSSEEVIDLLCQLPVPGIREGKEEALLQHIAFCVEKGSPDRSCSELARALHVTPRTIRRYSHTLQGLGVLTVGREYTKRGRPLDNRFSVNHAQLLQLALGDDWREKYEMYRAEKA